MKNLLVQDQIQSKQQNATYYTITFNFKIMVLLGVRQVLIFQRHLLPPSSASSSSEMLVYTHYTMQRYIPKDSNFLTYCLENLRSHIWAKFFLLSLCTDTSLSIAALSTTHSRQIARRIPTTTLRVSFLFAGLCITGIMAVLVGCRLRVVRRRLRRGGKSPYAHDADYLVNGMYL